MFVTISINCHIACNQIIYVMCIFRHPAESYFTLLNMFLFKSANCFCEHSQDEESVNSHFASIYSKILRRHTNEYYPNAS